MIPTDFCTGVQLPKAVCLLHHYLSPSWSTCPLPGCIKPSVGAQRILTGNILIFSQSSSAIGYYQSNPPPWTRYVPTELHHMAFSPALCVLFLQNSSMRSWFGGRRLSALILPVERRQLWNASWCKKSSTWKVCSARWWKLSKGERKAIKTGNMQCLSSLW